MLEHVDKSLPELQIYSSVIYSKNYWTSSDLSAQLFNEFNSVATWDVIISCEARGPHQKLSLIATTFLFVHGAYNASGVEIIVQQRFAHDISCS